MHLSSLGLEVHPRRSSGGWLLWRVDKKATRSHSVYIVWRTFLVCLTQQGVFVSKGNLHSSGRSQ